MTYYAVYSFDLKGERHFHFLKPAFDVQKWAESRRESFKVLGITKIEFEEIKTPSNH